MCQSQYIWDSLNVISILELKLIKQLPLGLCGGQKYQHEAIGAFAQNCNISLDKVSHLVKVDISQVGQLRRQETGNVQGDQDSQNLC